MSTYYYLYAEVQVDGNWMSLNPVMRGLNGEFKSSELLYFTHSSMSEVYYALEQEVVSRGLPEDCSAGVREHFHDLEKKVDDWGVERTWREIYERDVFVVNYKAAVKRRVRKDRPYKYMYYVPRETVASFECGEIDEIVHWLTREEYLELDAESKREYVYFEWNNWWDEYQLFCEIAKRIDVQLRFLENFISRDVADGQVRIIVRRC